MTGLKTILAQMQMQRGFSILRMIHRGQRSALDQSNVISLSVKYIVNLIHACVMPMYQMISSLSVKGHKLIESSQTSFISNFIFSFNSGCGLSSLRI